MPFRVHILSLQSLPSSLDSKMAPKRKTSVTGSIARGSRTSLKLLDPERDEVVKYAWDTLWQGLVDHVIDKQYYPRYVASAVATTVAQMVQMLCFNQLTRMDDWNHSIVGQHLEEWEEDKESQLPPIDSWARQCLPMEIKSKKPDFFDDKDFKASLAQQREGKGHRSSDTILLSVQKTLGQRRNSTQLQMKPRRATEVGNIQTESDKLFRSVKKWATLHEDTESSKSSDSEANSHEVDEDVGNGDDKPPPKN